MKPSIFFVLFSHGVRLAVAITCYSVDLFVYTQSDLSLCCCAHRFILRNSSHLLQTNSSVDAVCKSLTPASSFPLYLAIKGSDWRFLCFLFYLGLQWGSWYMKKTFSRLPISTLRNPIVKSNFFCFCFLLSLSRTDHIDQSWKLQTEKKMNECSVFHCGLWLYTNFLGFFLLL